MRVASILANSVRSGGIAGRRVLDIPRTKPVTWPTVSGGDDGLYRLTFPTGDVVELTVVQNARTVVDQVIDADAGAS
jgi:hypothetical protein